MLEETKPWYLSKTIWSGVSTTVLAILMACHVLPQSLSESVADETTLVLLGLATIYSRVKATAKIEKKTDA